MSGSSFLESLYQSDQISKKIFSVHFDNYGNSEIEFGGYDPSKYPESKPLTFLETTYDPLWKFTINGFRVGEKPTFPNGASTAYYTPQYDAILDTFNPYIKIPKTISTQVFNQFLHETDYRLVDDMLMGPCEVSQYWSISLFVNDRYYVKLDPASFVMDIGKGDKCFLPFQYNDVDEWVLGEPFFRSFYTVFDDSKGLVGLAPSINYIHASVIEGIVPYDELKHPDYQKKKEEDKEKKDKIPDNLSNPIAMFKYMCRTAYEYFFPNNSSTDTDGGEKSDKTDLTLLTTFIVLGCVFCVMNLFIIYCCIQYQRYSKNNK